MPQQTKTLGIDQNILMRLGWFDRDSMRAIDDMLSLIQGQIAAINGQVPLDTRDIFSIANYGADLTGASNSTTAVRTAMAAAWANVQATGRRSVVYFPPGRVNLTGKTTQKHININGMSKLTFAGVPGGRSLLDLNGDSGL